MAETIEMPSVAIVSCGAIFVPLCPLVRECLSRATAIENSIARVLVQAEARRRAGLRTALRGDSCACVSAGSCVVSRVRMCIQPDPDTCLPVFFATSGRTRLGTWPKFT